MITNRPGFSLDHLSNDELLASLGKVLGSQRRLTAELIAHLAEMDSRKLYLSQATSSLFVYCVQRLGFGEDEACRRIDAARLARRFPVIYGMLEAGEVSLSVLGRLKSLIDANNANELLALVRGKSVRDAERLLAARFPKPDVPDRIRKLPDVQPAKPKIPDANQRSQKLESPLFAQDERDTKQSGRLLDCDGSGAASLTGPATANPSLEPTRAKKREKVTPLATDRFEIRFTLSRAQEEKLRRALDLTSHENPKRELAILIETALDLLVAERMKRKFGETKRRQKKQRSFEVREARATPYVTMFNAPKPRRDTIPLDAKRRPRTASLVARVCCGSSSGPTARVRIVRCVDRTGVCCPSRATAGRIDATISTRCTNATVAKWCKARLMSFATARGYPREGRRDERRTTSEDHVASHDPSLAQRQGPSCWRRTLLVSHSGLYFCAWEPRHTRFMNCTRSSFARARSGLDWVA